MIAGAAGLGAAASALAPVLLPLAEQAASMAMGVVKDLLSNATSAGANATNQQQQIKF